MFAEWSTVLDEAAGSLAMYIEYTAFTTKRDKATLRTLQSVLDKADRKLSKYAAE